MKESPREVKVSLTALAILLKNVFDASKDDAVGFVDADQTLGTLVREFEKDVWVNTELLESALYYSNILSEQDKMWHPYGDSFHTFVTKILPKDIGFDKYYNTLFIEDKK